MATNAGIPDKGGVGSIPTAALDGDSLYLPVGGVSKVKLNESGVVGEPQWKTTSLQNGMSSPLVYGGRVYAANGQGFVSCADSKTGKELFKERVKGAFSASPIAGDGKIYCLNETGVCTVLKADSNEFDILATNDLGEETLATPAIANGLIFIRTDKAVYAIEK